MSAKRKPAKRSRETWRVQWDSPRPLQDPRVTMTERQGAFDEAVLLDGEHRVFHVERMDRHAWWVGLGDGVMLWVQRGNGGRYRVTLTEGIDETKTRPKARKR